MRVERTGTRTSRVWREAAAVLWRERNCGEPVQCATEWRNNVGLRSVLRRHDSRRGARGEVRRAPSESGRVACRTFPTAEGGRAGSNEVVFDGVANDARIALQLQLVEDPAAIRAHRLWAQPEFGRDLFERDAGAEHAQHLVLPVGERVVPGPRPASPEAGDEHAGKRRAYV